MKTPLLIIALLFSYFSYSQYTTIPDSNFENALSAYDDFPNDGQIPTANINTITTLNVSSQGISSLTGIQDFTALKVLNCKTNNLTSLDITNNLNLRKLYCSLNQLTGINTSSNTLLQYFYCDNNAITSLDVSNNTNLTRLYCFKNQLSSINTINNTNLLRLYCNDNQINSLDVSTNVLLKYLYCQKNLLSALNVSTNVDLIRLYCNTNQITSLNVNTNVNLKYLYCFANLLGAINTSNNSQLERLYCYSNQISSLNTSSNPNLIRFYCNSNLLTSLDVSANSSLTYLRCQNNSIGNLVLNPSTLIELNCSSNQLTSIDVSAHTNLINLYLHVNQFTDLDVSPNVNLVKFYCNSNQLVLLNVRNGNNTNISLFKSYNNPNLTCIEVDDVAYSTTNWIQIDAASSFSTSCPSLTYVPDNNFETYLETHDASGTVVAMGSVTSMGNGVMDDYVTTANIDTVTILNVSNLSIADMTGIEDFTSLVQLDCSNNQITTLDFTSNINLAQLSCHANLLTGLNITSNNLLTNLTCFNNQLTSLNVTNNTLLLVLWCYDNQLTSLNVNANVNMYALFCGQNLLTTLDLTNNVLLDDLRCNSNQLTNLDLSMLTSLISIDVSSNLLTNLNVQNGNNTNVVYFKAISNPNLTCIEVDNAAYSTTNWTQIDAASTFSLHCPFGETYVPDNNFEAYLEANGMGNGIANDDYVTTANINTVTSLTIPGLSIADLTGIEDFLLLQTLFCYNNLLISIDVSQNINLLQLHCGGNQLTNLDVTSNSQLTYLVFGINQITNIDLTQNLNLNTLGCYSNQLSSLNVALNLNLTNIDARNNLFTSLDLSLNSSLTTLRVNSNQLTNLNVKNGNNVNVTLFEAINNPNLLCIEVDDVAYSTTNWTIIDPASSFSLHCPLGETYVPDNNFETYLETHDASGAVVVIGDPTSMGNGVMDDYVTTANINTVTVLNIIGKSIADLTGIEDFLLLEELFVGSNNLATVDLSNNTALTKLEIYNNQLTTIDVSALNLLQVFHIASNNLTAIDVSNNPNLGLFRCQANNISVVDVSLNPLLYQLYVNQNSLSSLDVSLNPILNQLYCYNNNLTSLNVKNGNNTNFTAFNSQSNPNLICIEVDDPVYSTTNWTLIDAASSFSNDCPNLCSYPSNLLAMAPTTTGATLSWQENGTATVWDLEIGGQGFTPTGTVTNDDVTNPFVLVGGTPNTSYDYYVRADCSGTNTTTSAWSGPFTFSTLTVCETGNFTLDTTTPFNGVMTSSMAFADIDGDGDQDVLITGLNSGNQPISELYTNVSGSFTLVAGTPFTAVRDSSIAFADVDNDGDQDVLISGKNNSGVWVAELYLNNGFGIFTIDNTVPITGSSLGFVTFGDVDGNGFKDLIVAGYTDTKLYTNSGGVFTLSANIFPVFGRSAVDFADVNGDGDLDLVISGDDGTNQYFSKLYDNDGVGNFTYNTGVSLQGVFRGDNEFADIDNDGDLDLLVTGYNAGTYYSNLYENDGSGAFVLFAAPFNNIFASSVSFGDVDSDGDQDVVISGLSQAGIRISKLYLNNGLGFFTLQGGTPFDGIDSGSIGLADIDNDSDLDLLITGQNVSSVRISKLYLNDTYYNTTYFAAVWDNGTPTLNKCAVINQDYTTTSFSSYKTTVNTSKVLTIAASTYMEVQKNIVNNGTITIEPTGSIVQIDDIATVTGSGIFNTKIVTTPLQDATRYTYFSSPSATETLNVFASWADLSYLWEFNETTQGWDYISNTATPMQAGNGYIVRGNASNTYPGYVGLTSFQNAYNNGVITQNLHFKSDGSATANLDNDSNLVGNPYPSAISGVKLLNATLNPTAGTLYFWSHNSAMVAGDFSADDYAMWNLSGGTVAISGGTLPTGYIASGQGFFIEAEGDETLPLGQEVISTLTFNNEMRETGNNTDFRRPENSEYDKIWLNLTNTDGVFNQLLVSFFPNTTTAYEHAYDGKRSPNGVATFYSKGLNNEHFGIQALPLLQDETLVPLGYQIENENINNLQISIDHVENLENVTVYLKDNLLGTIHDLSQSEYSFSVINTGIFDTRFELLFRNSALNEEDIVFSESLIVSNVNEDQILVKTAHGSIINKIKVFDSLGRLIINSEHQDGVVKLQASNINQGTVLFIKVTLENGIILHKKTIKL